jgi:hypothetical protein
MLFTNDIANIVHTVADSFHGAANKNLGDAFLMVWKFKEEDEIMFLNERDEVRTDNLRDMLNYSDLAVLGFLKTIANIKKLT